MKKKKKINYFDPKIRMDVLMIHAHIGKFLLEEDEFKKVRIEKIDVYPISEPKIRIINFVILDKYGREVECEYVSDEKERKVFIRSGKDIFISSSFFAVKIRKMKKFLKYVLRNRVDMLSIKTLNNKHPRKGRVMDW